MATKSKEQSESVGILLASRWKKADVASYLGISLDELERDYAEEIRTGPARAIDEITRVIYAKAIEGDAEAIALIEEMHIRNPLAWPLLEEIKRQ